MVVFISFFSIESGIAFTGWYEMIETPDTLVDVWGSSGKDVFAVGGDSNDNGTILHYDGSTWSSLDVISPPLNGVWGSSGNDVFAVGDYFGYGTILHYDGSSWSEIESGTGAQLRGVWGTSGSDVLL
jgi:hypothetical protein